ncbi:hypothetical protein [Metabacillus litoralis]|uniref:hypothetical protein n=1 Tax=Metabacillus litoralis TaxID=152268 RepID=UPI00203A740D|nr:hypothetical protein [Metabacillus litoralis]MCM3162705.1 hypothetical protein [Metabacillus litoralis]
MCSALLPVASAVSVAPTISIVYVLPTSKLPNTTVPATRSVDLGVTCTPFTEIVPAADNCSENVRVASATVSEE